MDKSYQIHYSLSLLIRGDASGDVVQLYSRARHIGYYIQHKNEKELRITTNYESLLTT